METVREPFTFGIPLVARASSRDWPLVEALLDLTLTSVRAQTDRAFRIVVAGHDRPRALPPEATFIEAHWPAEAVRPDNLDSGRKKHAIQAHVLASGGGLLMLLDADDWVDARLVETARATIGPDHVGGLIATGFAVDLRHGRAAPLPHPRIFEGAFHRVCGSSTVARLRPDADSPLLRDPLAVLHEHYRWTEMAREHGAALARLPVLGAYVVNTAGHSETHGLHVEWRQGFNGAVRREGSPLDDALLVRFGLNSEDLRAVSERLAVQHPTTIRSEPALP